MNDQRGQQPPAGSLPSRTEGSFLLHAAAPRYHWSGEGWLSIKTFSHGRALYRAGGGVFAVDDTGFLILNHGQPYEIEIDSSRPVESFGIFFAPGLIQDVGRNLCQAQDALLVDPSSADEALPEFQERTYPYSDGITRILQRLRRLQTMGTATALLQEPLYELAWALFQTHAQVRREIDGLAAARLSTREELYRRVYLAKEFMAACYDQPISLDDMARVACLSPNHLLRSFRQVFGQTPHQFLTTIRLDHARRLLETTDLPVTDVCIDVGFRSLGSFSDLFRRTVGLSPAAYRAVARNG